MNLETNVSVASAVIALTSMLVAIWQAKEARGARKIAGDQAKTAEEALAETRKQTKLAQDANTNAVLNLDAAEKAANAAQTSADEARKANALVRQQQACEDSNRAAAALARARKVSIELSGMGGYSVHVTNDADEPFYRIALEEFRRHDRPSWGWRLAPTVVGVPAVYDKVNAWGGECRFYVELLDENGTPQRFDMNVVAGFTCTISYFDANGQGWRRTGGADPEPLDRLTE